MTDFARTGIFAAVLLASARNSAGIVRPSSPMPPTFSRCRRETRLCRRPQQANVLEEFMSAPENEFFGIQQSPGQIFKSSATIFCGLEQSYGLLQFRRAWAPGQCSPIKLFNQFAVGVSGIEK